MAMSQEMIVKIVGLKELQLQEALTQQAALQQRVKELEERLGEADGKDNHVAPKAPKVQDVDKTFAKP